MKKPKNWDGVELKPEDIAELKRIEKELRPIGDALCFLVKINKIAFDNGCKVISVELSRELKKLNDKCSKRAYPKQQGMAHVKCFVTDTGAIELL